MILRVKTHKTCKIEVKTRKPVKSVKPGQTRIKMGQLEKNIKNVTFSRVNQNFQQMQKFWNALWLSSLFSVPIPTPPHPTHDIVKTSSLSPYSSILLKCSLSRSKDLISILLSPNSSPQSFLISSTLIFVISYPIDFIRYISKISCLF
jgi:hypothetical protein